MFETDPAALFRARNTCVHVTFHLIHSQHPRLFFFSPPPCLFPPLPAFFFLLFPCLFVPSPAFFPLSSLSVGSSFAFFPAFFSSPLFFYSLFFHFLFPVCFPPFVACFSSHFILRFLFLRFFFFFVFSVFSSFFAVFLLSFFSLFFFFVFIFSRFFFIFLRFFFVVFFLFFDSAISPPIFMSCLSHTEACNALGTTDGVTSHQRLHAH